MHRLVAFPAFHIIIFASCHLIHDHIPTPPRPTSTPCASSSLPPPSPPSLPPAGGDDCSVQGLLTQPSSRLCCKPTPLVHVPAWHALPGGLSVAGVHPPIEAAAAPPHTGAHAAATATHPATHLPPSLHFHTQPHAPRASAAVACNDNTALHCTALRHTAVITAYQPCSCLCSVCCCTVQHRVFPVYPHRRYTEIHVSFASFGLSRISVSRDARLNFQIHF